MGYLVLSLPLDFSSYYISRHIPSDNYLFRVNNRKNTTRYEIFSKLTLKTSEWRHDCVCLVFFHGVHPLFLKGGDRGSSKSPESGRGGEGGRDEKFHFKWGVKIEGGWKIKGGEGGGDHNSLQCFHIFYRGFFFI